MCYTSSMPNLSIRFSDEETEALDRLVIAVRAFYEGAAPDFPAAAQLARETTRSSALRDLLRAWQRRDDIPSMFSVELTKETK